MLSSAEIEALALSLRVAFVATLLGVGPAVAVAHWLVGSRSGWRRPVEVAVGLPLVLPPVVTGYLLLLVLAPTAPLGAAWQAATGTPLAFTWVAAALAASVVAFPLMVRTVAVALAQVDPEHVRNARTLGAGPWRTFFEVRLPLARGGVAAAAVLGFARSLGEFGATIVVAGNIAGATRTLPLAIYSELQRPGGETAVLRLALLSVVLAVVAMLAGEWLQAGARPGRRRAAGAGSVAQRRASQGNGPGGDDGAGGLR